MEFLPDEIWLYLSTLFVAMAANKKGVEAGRAYVKAWLDDSAVTRGIKRMKAGFHSAGRGLMTVGGGMLGAGAGIAALFVKPLQAASDLQETMSKFDTVFGDRSASVSKWGENLAETIGRSDTEVKSFLANTQDLLVPLGMSSGAAEGMSKEVTKLAYDLASFNNMADGDVVRDLHAALTGSGEVMKKYGVVVSEAAVKQQLLNEGIDPKKATEAQKAQARFNLILAGTTAAQGDAEKTAGSWANQKKRLAAQLQKVSETIGTAVLPILTPLLTKTSELVGWTANWIKENAGLARIVIVGAGALMGFGAAAVVAGFAFTTLGTVIGALLTAVGLLVSPIGLIVAGLAAAAGAGLYLAHQSGLLGKVVDWLKDRFGPLAKIAKDAFDTIKNALMAGEFGAAAKVAMAAMKLAFAEGLAWLRKQWVDAKEFLANVWIGLSSQIESIWSTMTTAMIRMLLGAASKSFEILAGIADKLGMSQKAMELRMMSGGIGAVGSVHGNGEQEAIAKRQRDAEEMNAQMADEQRKAIGDTTAEQEAFAKAMAEARKATEAATIATEEKKTEEQTPPGSDMPGSVAKAAKPAINTAAHVASQAGADIFLKATQGGRDDAVVNAVKEQTTATKQMTRELKDKLRKPVVVAVGRTK